MTRWRHSQVGARAVLDGPAGRAPGTLLLRRTIVTHHWLLLSEAHLAAEKKADLPVFTGVESATLQAVYGGTSFLGFAPYPHPIPVPRPLPEPSPFPLPHPGPDPIPIPVPPVIPPTG